MLRVPGSLFLLLHQTNKGGTPATQKFQEGFRIGHEGL